MHVVINESTDNNMKLILRSLAGSTNIELTLLDKDTEIGQETVAQGEEIVSALDRILKNAKLNKTEITEIELAAESGASETSQRITRAFQMAFDFVQAQHNQF